MTVQKVIKMKSIDLTIDDIKKAIERYIDEEIIEIPNGCDIKFIIKEVYQPNSLTGYYYPELQSATVSVNTKEN
jgi:hypothetical protein